MCHQELLEWASKAVFRLCVVKQGKGNWVLDVSGYVGGFHWNRKIVVNPNVISCERTRQAIIYHYVHESFGNPHTYIQPHQAELHISFHCRM